MPKNYTQTPENFIKKYLKKLKGFDLYKAKDVVKFMRELRELSKYCLGEINNGSNLFKQYLDINTTLLELYDKLPQINMEEKNKLTVDEALEILFGGNEEVEIDEVNNDNQEN